MREIDAKLGRHGLENQYHDVQATPQEHDVRSPPSPSSRTTGDDESVPSETEPEDIDDFSDDMKSVLTIMVLLRTAMLVERYGKGNDLHGPADHSSMNRGAFDKNWDSRVHVQDEPTKTVKVDHQKPLLVKLGKQTWALSGLSHFLHRKQFENDTKKDPSGSLYHSRKAELGIALAQSLIDRGCPDDIVAELASRKENGEPHPVTE
ncbi:uncharacterized protein BO96DRAFT_328110 [Aspergillus niger CBS 101883]|uniref:uncharacterized protein n=1 Tax=Aspergillus lacticoffeatus (strain CBS 101883) TaxID=1450533 RepID=UPI000D7F1A5D|nr:uncharacterized protein BO96DRAFT_328110 [Aspergillus niger CBS 101883]PYH60417.1 hypothetical protein BO96DRAFT_328110 [Aspergillus niger CBS 101883]